MNESHYNWPSDITVNFLGVQKVRIDLYERQDADRARMGVEEVFLEGKIF